MYDNGYVCVVMNDLRYSGAGESSLRSVSDDWSSVHVEFFIDLIWRQQRLQLRFQVTSLASWSCRRTTHQHQSTRLYWHGHTTWPCHVSTIWLRLGDDEQEERVSMWWRWSSVTSKSCIHVRLQQCRDCSGCIQWTTTQIPAKTWRLALLHNTSLTVLFFKISLVHAKQHVCHKWLSVYFRRFYCLLNFM